MIKKIEIKSTAGVKSHFHGMYKEYRQSIEPWFSKGNSQKFKELIAQGKISSGHVKSRTSRKFSPHLSGIVEYFFKQEKIQEHYTEEVFIRILHEFYAKQINKNKTIELSAANIEDIYIEFLEYISNLQELTYAFQIEHFSLEGDKISFENVEIRTFEDEEFGKIIVSSLYSTMPKMNTRYKTFLAITSNENDEKMAYRKMRMVADSIIGLVILLNPKSPLVKISDFYLRKHEGKWYMSYRHQDRMHWDLITSKNTLEKSASFLSQLANPNMKNDLYICILSSLSRFRFSETIATDSLRFAEIMGCIETLLILRHEGGSKESDGKSGIPSILARRIVTLSEGRMDFDETKKILARNYDTRSNYQHQSAIDELEKEIISLTNLFAGVLEKTIENLERFNSKKDFIASLDKEEIESVQEGTEKT